MTSKASKPNKTNRNEIKRIISMAIFYNKKKRQLCDTEIDSPTIQMVTFWVTNTNTTSSQSLSPTKHQQTFSSSQCHNDILSVTFVLMGQLPVMSVVLCSMCVAWIFMLWLECHLACHSNATQMKSIFFLNLPFLFLSILHYLFVP